MAALLGQNFQMAMFFKAAKDLEALCGLTVFNTWKISLSESHPPNIICFEPYLLKYLFIYLLTASGLSCGTRDL